MIFNLAGGAGGIEAFIDNIGAGWEALWSDMANWTKLPEETRARLQSGLDAATAETDMEALARWRDAKLVQILRVLSEQS